MIGWLAALFGARYQRWEAAHEADLERAWCTYHLARALGRTRLAALRLALSTV